jgi:hypothetical protein
MVKDNWTQFPTPHSKRRKKVYATEPGVQEGRPENAGDQKV